MQRTTYQHFIKKFQYLPYFMNYLRFGTFGSFGGPDKRSLAGPGPNFLYWGVEHVCKEQHINISSKNVNIYPILWIILDLGLFGSFGDFFGPINICGFCGGNTCENLLKKTSKQKSKVFYKVQSNCSYFVEWKKTPAFSIRNPCSNHLICCSICNASIWVYNVKHHYDDRHLDLEVPTLVTQDEINKLLKKWAIREFVYIFIFCSLFEYYLVYDISLFYILATTINEYFA